MNESDNAVGGQLDSQRLRNLEARMNEVNLRGNGFSPVIPNAGFAVTGGDGNWGDVGQTGDAAALTGPPLANGALLATLDVSVAAYDGATSNGATYTARPYAIQEDGTETALCDAITVTLGADGKDVQQAVAAANPVANPAAGYVVWRIARTNATGAGRIRFAGRVNL